jgi:hypothetical protein
MKFLRKALVILLALILLAAIWIWWNRPQKVEMAAYVPADSLLYLEANDLPIIASSLINTDAWKALAPAAGIRSDAGRIGWLSRLASWTGIGSSEAVVFSRAQIAIAILGFDAAAADETLKIKPRYAVIVETHTGESRTRYAVEQRLGEFARHAYGDPRVEQREADGVHFTTWSAPDGERHIVAAIKESVAIVGNDESAVEACLAVRRGERPSLKGNPQMEEMRRRVGGTDALAFGYVSPEGAARLLELAGTAYATQISQDPRAQSAAASILPSLAKKILGGAGWSAHLSNGSIEDRYFMALQNGMAERLKPSLASDQKATLSVSDLLPANTYSISRYSYRDPAEAWKGLNTTVTSQFDTLAAILVGRLLETALKPYGIEEPDSFLRAIGSEFVTARLDDTGGSTVTIVEVRNEQTLRDFVSKRLGAKPRSETIGDNQMLVSNNEKHDAASFVGDHLILGSEENVRRCLQALAQKETLANADDFQKSLQTVTSNAPSSVVTFTDERASTRSFVEAIANQKGMRERPLNQSALENALTQLRYATSETQLVEGGFERRTLSSFGQFGTLASQFVQPAESETGR